MPVKFWKHFRKNLIFEKKISIFNKNKSDFLAYVTAASRILLKNQPIWLSRYIYLHLLYREVKGILYFQLYFTGKLSCTLPRVPKTNFAPKTSKEQRRMLCRQNWLRGPWLSKICAQFYLFLRCKCVNSFSENFAERVVILRTLPRDFK